MKKNNEMTKKAFWTEIIILTFVLGVVFYFWGFRNCFSLDRKGSVILYCVMTIVIEFIFGLMSVRRQKNIISIWSIVLLPLEVYSLLVYFTAQTWRVLLLVAVWALAVITWLLISTHNALGKDQDFKLNKKTIPQLLRMIWVLGVAVYLIFIVPIMLRSARGIEVSLEYSIVNNDTSGYTITSKMAELSVFDQEKWKKLDREHREQALQLVVDIETNMLGLSYKINVGIRDFGETEIFSAYTAADHKILIDEDALMNLKGEELINMVCHQAYHAYQRSLVDLYMNTDRGFQKLLVFENVESYIAELQKDIQALDDRTEADNEKLEAIALVYAEEQTAEYVKWIEFWENSNK